MAIASVREAASDASGEFGSTTYNLRRVRLGAMGLFMWRAVRIDWFTPDASGTQFDWAPPSPGKRLPAFGSAPSPAPGEPETRVVTVHLGLGKLGGSGPRPKARVCQPTVLRSQTARAAATDILTPQCPTGPKMGR